MPHPDFDIDRELLDVMHKAVHNYAKYKGYDMSDNAKDGQKIYYEFAELTGDPCPGPPKHRGEGRFWIVNIKHNPEVDRIIHLIAGPHHFALLKIMEARNAKTK